MQSIATDILGPRDDTVRSLLKRCFERAGDVGDGPFVKMGMSVTELEVLYALAHSNGCRSALEVGMGSGTSTVVLRQALEDCGGELTSIDPFQSTKEGFDSAGVRALRTAGLHDRHTLIEAPNYLALPELLAKGRRFDFVFIDGWHSFDYTLVDVFYADLLLDDGGILALHDTTAPAVFKAVRFLETHKPYARLSPPLAAPASSLGARAWRKLGTWLSGPTAAKEALARRECWRMLSAYRKLESQQTPQTLVAAF